MRVGAMGVLTVLFLAGVCFPSFCFADKVVLGNGDVIEGSIVEENPEYVKVDTAGVIQTYYSADIKEVKRDLVSQEEKSLIKNQSVYLILEKVKSLRKENRYEEAIEELKKAVKIAKFTKKLTMGEDSGLCVDALGGKPGVYSSRFAGKGKSDQQNNLKLLKMLEGLPLNKRKAHYSCAVALADKDGVIGVVEGTCSGIIGFEFKGHFGFGYDPLFIIPKYKKTFAQLGPRIKHKMSHRFRALQKAKKLLATYLK